MPNYQKFLAVLILNYLMVFGVALDSGLVAYFPLDGHPIDINNLINNGVVYGGTNLTTDRFSEINKSYSFNGNDGFINCGNDSILNTPNQLSISLWVLPVDSTIQGHMLSKGQGAGITPETWDFVQNRSQYAFRVNGISATASADKMVLNEWVHLTGVYDRSNISLFINGRLCTLNIGTVTIPNTGKPLLIGRSSDPRAFYFKGKIDDIRIYNRALTSAEIAYLFDHNNNIVRLVSPQAVVRERRPYFRWRQVSSIQTYEIQISSNISFQSPLVANVLPDSFYQPQTDLPFGRIYWRVKTNKDSGYCFHNTFDLINHETLVVPGDYITLQRAICLANDGDKINCHSIPDAKDTIIIKDKALYIKGIDSLAQKLLFSGTLILSNSNSSIENLKINGKNGANGRNDANYSTCGSRATAGGNGTPSLLIYSSNNVILTNLILNGGNGGNGGLNSIGLTGQPCYGLPGGNGADALMSNNSKLIISTVAVNGGTGGTTLYTPKSSIDGVGGRFIVNSIIDTLNFIYDTIYKDNSSLINVHSAIESYKRANISNPYLLIYPTPFNPSTNIRYALSENQKGSLLIYSSNGTLILKQKVQGHGNFHWDARTMASGIYLCELNTNNKVFTSKMILIR